MPLTGAEKTRRYREKLKQNRPEEYKAQCKRNLQRMKSKKKKISEMTPNEAEEQRKKWREEKRRSNKQKKEKKNEQTETRNEDNELSVLPEDKTQIKLRKIKNKLLRKCRNYTLQIQKLKTQKERYKKRYQRFKDSARKQIDNLENERIRQKAREEVMEYTLKMTYKKTKTQKEKNALRKLVQNTTNKKYVRKMMGLKGIRKQKDKIRRVEIAEIITFYLRDDVSRNTAGKKQTKCKNKIKMQIRYLTDSLVNLYKKYRSEGGRFGFTTFYKQKPFYVISPHLNARDTCLCIKHSNLEFQHASLKRNGYLKNSVREVLNEISCDTKKYSCMYSNCNDCKDKKPLYSTLENKENDLNISWLRWERKDHTYTRNEGNEIKEIKTKKTGKIIKTGTLETLRNEFEKDLQAFKKHHFNMLHQQKQYQIAVSQLKNNEVLIICDFSENYEAKLSSEIQAMHFGASKNQITLHTGMIYWNKKSQSFCTIAEVNNHQPPAIWAHLMPLLDLIKHESPNISVVHFFSDGPSSQYRQKNNFYLLTHFAKCLGLDYATWSFFESGHGKSVADGIGGCVKRTLDRKVCQGMDVPDAKSAYEILNQCLKNIKVFVIPDNAITEINNILPANVQALKGTLRVHQIITIADDNSIKFRDVSCFCGPLPGHCDCFSPQIHHVTLCNIKIPLQIKTKNISCSIPPPQDCLPSTSKGNLIPETAYQDCEISNTELEQQVECLTILDLEDIENVTGFDNSDLPIDVAYIDMLPMTFIHQNDLKCEKEHNAEAFIIENTASSSTTDLKPLRKDKIIKKNKLILDCHKCTCSILGKKAKCMVCSKWYCEECVDGSPMEIDYICDKCLAD